MLQWYAFAGACLAHIALTYFFEKLIQSRLKGSFELHTTVARKRAFELYCTDFRYFAGVVPLICLKVLMK